MIPVSIFPGSPLTDFREIQEVAYASDLNDTAIVGAFRKKNCAMSVL
jgi:hypothetical protein